VLDFDDPTQRQQLARLLASADVVIEASRPRALRQLGLDRESLEINNPQIWLSITAYGREPPAEQWVGFGDDVAVSAGLLHWDERGHPQFVGDAIADPLTGVYGALAVVESLAQGRSGLLDVSMASIARRCRQKILAAGQDIVCPLSAATSC
jgi:crotonobetainyl-CoA:carnitine CoA-transferase CaiB-like acyl-CoA transferase